MSRGHYRTKQHEAILACLRKNNGRHLTAGEIATALRQGGPGVSSATI